MQPSLSMNGPRSHPGEPSTVDLSGRCVGNSYVLVCPVGQGATGTVWRGIDRATGEQVAVKLLHEGLLRQPKLVTRFVQERTILMMVRHENIVGVRDLFSAGESIGLVMDFVAGGSLRDRLRERGTLPAAEAASLSAQVAAALTETHALGVVHRDVKPDNVLLSEDDDGVRVRLTDFGIARVLDTAGLTTPHAIIGTPRYMAPETISGGEATPAADVYALGIMLYELVCGYPPYDGEPFAVLHGHLEEPVPRPPGMPEPVWSVVRDCLDKDPERRPAAARLQEALRGLARDMAGMPALPAPAEPPGVDPPVLPASPARPARRAPRNRPRSWLWGRHGLVITAVCGVLAATGWGGYHAWQLLDGFGRAPAAAQPAPDRGIAAGPMPSVTVVPPLPPAAVAGRGPDTAAAGPAPIEHASSGRTAPRAGATPIARGAGIGVTAGPAQIGASAGPGRVGGSVAFHPWVCSDKYSFDLGHPMLVQPCHALGPAIRAVGRMEAVPGVQADISLTVRDAETDEVVAGPYTCSAQMFTDAVLQHTCGPVELQAPHGGRYVVEQSWEYTNRPLLPGGSVRGPQFTW
ncbi:serine/threonine-protein kinase [Actinoplanes oblitus]|uniref:mitogen-activated protein kinase kinase n=1 Tax=Actinoplanes oblitus TaxID=3040509 RepID=A0ABY8WCP6_9ACTN|nr:serine/threonine-protein kinase [Actinoplanes oblitus]WIM95272.1 serine/threonine-protein kinase [Actinoplanes oblitus]